MKTLPDEAVEALAGRTPRIAGACAMYFGSQTYRVWSGIGDLTISGDVFKGIAARALIVPVGSEAGGGADGVTMRLSNVDPDVAATVENEDYHQKPVVIWRLVFSPDDQLLGAGVFMRGRCDVITVSESVGGESVIEMAVEGARRDMSRKGSRIRSDSDQRVLGGAIDGALRHISVAGRKTLNWGQKPAVAGGAFGGSVGTGLFGSINRQILDAIF